MLIGEFMTTSRDFPRKGLKAWTERKKAGLKKARKKPQFSKR